MEKICRPKFLLIFSLLIFVFFSSKSANACDPLGCLLAGKDQDILAIVTITDVIDSKTTVKADHYYEQSRQTPEESFFIDFQKDSSWVSVKPQIGEHYFVSLTCEESVCFPKWGVWQVDGIDYQTTQLLHVQNGDDAAVEWFVNGKGSNFYGMGENMYARTDSGDFEIYPEKEKNPLIKGKESLQNWSNRNEGFISLIQFLVFTIGFGLLIFFLKTLSKFRLRPKLETFGELREYANKKLTPDAYRLTLTLENSGKTSLDIECINVFKLKFNKINKNRSHGFILDGERLAIVIGSQNSIKPFGSDKRSFQFHFFDLNEIPNTLKIEITGKDFYKKFKIKIKRFNDHLFICNFCGQLTIFSNEVKNCQHCKEKLT